MTDAMVLPVAEPSPVTAKLVTESPPVTEVECVKCDCCGLTEECTPEYIERIRERYLGHWICGLCGEAVEDEIVRSKRLISTEEAVARHVSFCRSSMSSGLLSDPTVRIIATVRQILRRSLDSLTVVKPMPGSPSRKRSDGGGVTRSSELDS